MKLKVALLLLIAQCFHVAISEKDGHASGGGGANAGNGNSGNHGRGLAGGMAASREKSQNPAQPTSQGQNGDGSRNEGFHPRGQTAGRAQGNSGSGAQGSISDDLFVRHPEIMPAPWQSGENGNSGRGSNTQPTNPGRNQGNNGNNGQSRNSDDFSLRHPEIMPPPGQTGENVAIQPGSMQAGNRGQGNNRLTEGPGANADDLSLRHPVIVQPPTMAGDNPVSSGPTWGRPTVSDVNGRGDQGNSASFQPQGSNRAFEMGSPNNEMPPAMGQPMQGSGSGINPSLPQPRGDAMTIPAPWSRPTPQSESGEFAQAGLPVPLNPDESDFPSSPDRQASDSSENSRNPGFVGPSNPMSAPPLPRPNLPTEQAVPRPPLPGSMPPQLPPGFTSPNTGADSNSDGSFNSGDYDLSQLQGNPGSGELSSGMAQSGNARIAPGNSPSQPSGEMREATSFDGLNPNSPQASEPMIMPADWQGDMPQPQTGFVDNADKVETPSGAMNVNPTDLLASSTSDIDAPVPPTFGRSPPSSSATAENMNQPLIFANGQPTGDANGRSLAGRSREIPTNIPTQVPADPHHLSESTVPLSRDPTKLGPAIGMPNPSVDSNAQLNEESNGGRMDASGTANVATGEPDKSDKSNAKDNQANRGNHRGQSGESQQPRLRDEFAIPPDEATESWKPRVESAPGDTPQPRAPNTDPESDSPKILRQNSSNAPKLLASGGLQPPPPPPPANNFPGTHFGPNGEHEDPASAFGNRSM